MFNADFRPPLQKLLWVKFRNDSGETIPAGGVLRLTGFVVTDPEEGFYTAAKPNTYGSQYSHALNDELPVGSGKYGRCCLGQTVPALYDSADGTPAFGENWGPRDATWKLKKNTGGFRILGVVDSGRSFALVVPQPFIRFHGVTDAAIAKDASGTVSIYYGTGAGTDSTVNFTSVYNSFGDVAITKDVEVVWEGDSAGTSWKIVAAEC